MSGGKLPTTGIGAVTIGVAGTNVTLSAPVWLVLVGGMLMIAGTVLVRLSFRAGRSAGAR